MATHDVDQKILGRLANATASSNPLLSSALYRILGLSILLARRLLRARKLRKLDSTRDTKSLALYHHILWLSREGLAVLEIFVLPYSEHGQHGSELRILVAKLRASFYHVFCLFHNTPPISQLNSPLLIQPQLSGPLSPVQTNGHAKHPLPAAKNGSSRSPRNSTDNPGAPPKLSPAQERKAALRDAIPSMTSEASYITNPFASGVGLTPPPGIPNPNRNTSPGTPPTPQIPMPAAFLLPVMNYLPPTAAYFATATQLATQFLPGSNPLRLSVALEHAAFLWDCQHDHAGSRRLAKRAIADVYRAQEGMDDAEFEDAAGLVGTLGRMMKRSSMEGTPRMGAAGSHGTPVGAAPVLSPVESTLDKIGEEAPAPAPRGGDGERRKRSAEAGGGYGESSKEKRHSGSSGEKQRHSGSSGEKRLSGGSGGSRRSGERRREVKEGASTAAARAGRRA